MCGVEEDGVSRCAYVWVEAERLFVTGWKYVVGGYRTGDSSDENAPFLYNYGSSFELLALNCGV